MDAVVSMARPLVVRQLSRYRLSEDDRQDLLQETLLQVVRKIALFRGEANFSTWLFRVTANEVLMLMRSRRRFRARIVYGLEERHIEQLQNASVSETASDAQFVQQRHAQVREAVDKLPESYKCVVLAHYQQDLGLHEIARRFNITESAVRSRLHRARSRLRVVLMHHPVAA